MTPPWLTGYEDICARAEVRPETIRVVRVLDREADGLAWYEAQRTAGRVDVLVRARQDRPLAGGGRLLDRLRRGPPAREIRVEVRRLSARQKGQGRAHRTARVEVRFPRLPLKSPRKGQPP